MLHIPQHKLSLKWTKALYQDVHEFHELPDLFVIFNRSLLLFLFYFIFHFFLLINSRSFVAGLLFVVVFVSFFFFEIPYLILVRAAGSGSLRKAGLFLGGVAYCHTSCAHSGIGHSAAGAFWNDALELLISFAPLLFSYFSPSFFLDLVRQLLRAQRDRRIAPNALELLVSLFFLFFFNSQYRNI